MQSVINALVLSSIYIMVTLGFSLVFSIAGILNLAHGAIYMVGGYVCYLFQVNCGINQWMALFLTMLVMGFIGLLMEKFCFRPCRGSIERTLLMCLAIILVLETGVNVTLGNSARAIPPLLPGTVQIGGTSIASARLAALAISGGLLLIVALFIRKSTLGKSMLAISQDELGATLQGINTNTVSSLACTMGSGIAGLAGGIMGSLWSLNPFMGTDMLVKACALVIIGGIGSIIGILPAAFILGTVDAFLPIFIGGGFTNALSFGLIILILMIRPRGLFGREA